MGSLGERSGWLGMNGKGKACAAELVCVSGVFGGVMFMQGCVGEDKEEKREEAV